MRALITGINGFVAGHLAEHLLASGKWEVWGLSRSPHVELPSLAGKVRVVQANLADPEATMKAIVAVQPQVIYHLAGQPFVPESFRDPAATLATNTLGALHIFLTLIEYRMAARVLVVGTNEEYGKLNESDIPVSEETPLRPTSPYGVSKVAQSLLAQQYHFSHGLDVVRVRPFTHIGPRQNERFVTAAFARQIAQIERGLQPPVVQVGNLIARRDFTDVRDMVRAYALAMQYGESGAVYNVGSGQPVMIRELLDMLLEESTTRVEIRLNPELMRPIDIPMVSCDASRLRARTGWAPEISIRQTMRDILNYWRQEVGAQSSSLAAQP